MKKLLLFPVLLLLCSCTARQVVTDYEGSTAQRLVAHSVDRAARHFAGQNLKLLKNKKLYIEFNYLEGMEGHEYLRNRLLAELHYRGIETVADKSNADLFMDIFCVSLGTDNSYSGLTTPSIPTAIGSVPKIKIIGADLYRGISEFYYFLHDKSGKLYFRSDIINGKAKSDEYNLLFFKLNSQDF